MKKLKFFFFGLLILFGAILAGCGGGGGGGGNGNPPPSTIQFWTSGMYKADDGVYYGIPTGAKVQFYTLTEATYNKVINETAQIEADYVFTGTTGKDYIFNLPDYLKNQERYIFAVVARGNTSYDLKGQTIADAKNAAANGEILFGQTTSRVKLTSGGVISIGGFEGKAEGNPVKIISFTMPDTYLAGESELLIPNDKVVTFYCVTGSIGDTFSTDAYIFHGTTGSTKITKAMLPEALVGQSCYFYAVVNLDGFYDLRGKTISDVIEAIYDGKVLFGKSMDPVNPDEMKMYSLGDGVNIENFVFHGPIPDGVINFVMPETCVTGTSIPPGKTVKFYALKSTGEPLNADRVFTGTTGSGNIQCTLPGRLISQDYYFFAVVNIRGSFDLQGKTKQDLRGAISRGEVLFGQSKEPLGQNNKLYTLTDGITIDNFEFIDTVDQGGSKIKFTIPAKYKGPSSEPGADDGEEFDIPVGKRVKFYAITSDAYASAQENLTTVINCELIHEGITGGSNTYTADLPDHLLNQERCFLALIVLSETEDYDLSRMTVEDLVSAMSDGKVLYGRHLISGQGDIELVELTDGINEIDNFEFQGQEP